MQLSSYVLKKTASTTARLVYKKLSTRTSEN